jgi:hypothetical protein
MVDCCHEAIIFLPVTGVSDLHEEYVPVDGTASRERLTAAPKGDPTHPLNTAETIARRHRLSGIFGFLAVSAGTPR